MVLLEQVFKIINESGLKYCIQNKYEMMPEVIPSDIDMMYMDANEEFLDKLVDKIALTTGLIVTQKICQGFFEYTYILSYECPKERFQLQLDFYRAISRRGYLNIMPAEDMIETRRKYKCFYVPDYYIELKYIWIRRTIKKDLNNEHIEIARQLFKKNKIEYRKKLVNDFGEELTKIIERIIDDNDINTFYDNFALFNKWARKQSRKNSSICVRIKYCFFMLTKVIPKRIFHTCGISIAFISPDGGGKSTIINNIQNTVSGSFYKVNTFYFRPRLLKNIGHYNPVNPKNEDSINNSPHDKQLNGFFKSIIRFFYYNIDFIFGNFLKVFPKKVKKELVIFDRYYYDYFADLKRFQYKIPVFIPKLFACAIPKPNIIFVLKAEPEVLYNRKKELEIEEIKRQNAAFLLLGKKYKNVQFIDVSKSIDEVTDDVTTRILVYMNNYTHKIMK